MISKNKIIEMLNLDFTRFPYILILSLIFVLSRIPLLNLGFGSDSDAWRIANSAFDLYYFHIYHPSRFPGYPLVEFINSLIINHGWLTTNILTMVLSLISVIIFAMILKELEIKNKGLIIITYAFLPILWINSASTMDYMWALTFIILCWFLILKEKFVLAGLIFGLSIGSRPTSIFLIIPFIYLIYIKNKDAKNIFNFSFTSIIIASILFIPLYLQYGLHFITFYYQDLYISSVWSDASYLFGSIAIIFGIVILILYSKVLFEEISKKNKMLIFFLISTFLIIILFIFAPYETAYLIPAIPFGILLINEISKRKFFIILCMLLLLNSFVSISILTDNSLVEDGLIKKEMDIRAKLLYIDQKIVHSNMQNSIIISGEHLPDLCYLQEISHNNKKEIGMIGFGDLEVKEHLNNDKNVLYVYLLSSEKVKLMKEKNYNIYYTGTGVKTLNKYIYKYDLSDYNCSDLFTDYNKI